ncbi:MAG: Lrp/AsnC family transcriptional regulator [Proteobacteria bacterium]|nr:Lrp/AsnC family transcriptional regulator [Pseudomonadota bacterium]MCP4915526.1 Lrp/AsnC family transcriptional regulator [Pseudomonadota bacterium]
MPTPTLDRIDREIVRLLQNDSRLPYKQIAGEVGLAASTVYERIRRLERDGVLQGAHMSVAPTALGVRLEAMLFINLSAHQVGTQETLVEWMTTRPEVRGWFNLAGRLDFAVHVAARDADHLRDIVFHGFTSRPEVHHVETNMIFEQQRFHVLPDYLD